MFQKGQVSLEYISVFSLALVASIALTAVYVTQQGNIRSDIAQAKADNAARLLTNTFENVDVMGDKSKRTVRIEFPENTKSVVLDNDSFTINVVTVNRDFNVTRFVDTTLEGEIGDYGGLHVIEVENVNGTVTVSER